MLAFDSYHCRRHAMRLTIAVVPVYPLRVQLAPAVPDKPREVQMQAFSDDHVAADRWDSRIRALPSFYQPTSKLHTCAPPETNRPIRPYDREIAEARRQQVQALEGEVRQNRFNLAYTRRYSMTPITISRTA